MQISWNFLHELINDIFYNFLIDRTICKKNKLLDPSESILLRPTITIISRGQGYFFFRLVSG